MLLSFNWLKQFVKLPDSVTPEEVAEKLKLSTVEVEGIIKQGKNLNNIVVGKIVSVEKHPNADKLRVCQVSIGNESLTIVCGGVNLEVNQLVAVAKNGAKVLWHGAGDLVELKPATIRGVESNGMICASDEIGLSEMFPKKEEKEIINLGSLKTKPGTPLAVALGLNDAIFEIDNKSLSNRPDLWGHYGMAREVAVLFNREVLPYKVSSIKAGKEMIVTVSVDDAKACPKFAAVAISGITVGPSPAWLTEKLVAVGLRPINNIVDITNYVMLDCGKPIHAFDAGKLSGGLVIRHATAGEKLILLDDTNLALTADHVVVADEKNPLALAGIMGGKESAISDATTTVIFESAIWDAALIRQTATRLGLRTDASARFEKSLDPHLCEESLAKAAALTKELCPGAKVISPLVKVGEPRLSHGPIEIPVDFFEKKLGVVIPAKTIKTILERLGFGVTVKKKNFSVKIPSWRATKDISIPEDIVEEVLRIYGYDKVPSTLPMFTITPPEQNKVRMLERTLADVLVRELSYTEVYNYSFVSAEQIKRLGDDVSKYLELDNPISKERPFIRRNLPLNLLENITTNRDHADTLRFFEIGKVFQAEKPGLRSATKSDELLPRQDTWIAAVYSSKKDSNPFQEARHVAERAGAALNLPITFVAETSHPWHHPSRSATLTVGTTFVGRLYEFHPKILAAFGITERVSTCVFNITTLAEFAPKSQKYQSLSPYPTVTRDLAFVVSKNYSHENIQHAIKSVDPLITSVELFDVFEGEKIGLDKKSMAYHVTYGSSERTLTSVEVDTVEQKIKALLKKDFGAEVR